jgi:hypothetical protein
MFRRVVFRLLVLLLLVPGMCAAHSHAGTSAHDPSGLNRPPHFHLRFFYLWCQQYGNERNYYFHQGGHESTALTGSKPTADHDADAIYLSISVLLGWRSDLPVDPVSPLGLTMPPGTMCLADAAHVLVPSQELSPHAAHWQRCPIYLRSVTLLI